MRQAPPPAVWVVAGLLAAAAIALAYARHYVVPADTRPQQMIADFARKLLATPRQSGELRVMGLGTSLLWAAVPRDKIDPIEQPPWLKWMRMTKINPGLGVLAPALVEIERAPPDIVVIEKGLLFADDVATVNDSVKLDIKEWLKDTFMAVAGRAPVPSQARQLAEQTLAQLRTTVPCAPDFVQTPALRKVKVDALHDIYVQAEPNMALSAALLRLTRRGVRIIILDLPRSAELERTSASVKLQWYARLQQALPPGPMLAYMAAPSYPERGLYCDGAHLNRAGSRLFSTWWLTQLVALREGAH